MRERSRGEGLPQGGATHPGADGELALGFELLPRLQDSALDHAQEPPAHLVCGRADLARAIGPGSVHSLHRLEGRKGFGENLPAIDCNCLPGHVGSLVSCEEQCRVSDVLHLTETPLRDRHLH